MSRPSPAGLVSCPTNRQIAKFDALYRDTGAEDRFIWLLQVLRSKLGHLLIIVELICWINRP
jgi:hypothetical protein